MMKVLIAIFPFITGQPDIPGYDFCLNPWGHDPSSEEIAQELARDDYAGLIVGTKKVPNAIIESCPSLKVISRVGVGYNNIDVEFFKSRGVKTTYTPYGPTDSTAEMALAMILAGTRRLKDYDRQLRNKLWKREFGLRLMDATVGIVGFGRIGKRLAVLLHNFGCRIILHDINPDLATAHAMGWEFVSKEEILARADILTFHIPLKADTRDWMTDPEFDRLDRPVTIVNTARGGIVNEQAAHRFLVQNPASYYCCDVFEDEPYHGPLLELQNCLFTPHASSFTVGSRTVTEEQAIDNCIRVLRGEPCSNIVEGSE